MFFFKSLINLFYRQLAKNFLKNENLINLINEAKKIIFLLVLNLLIIISSQITLRKIKLIKF